MKKYSYISAFVALVILGSSLTVYTSADWQYGYPPYGYSSQPVLSQSTVSVGVGQSANISVTGGSGSYSMYTTSNNIFQAVLSGNALTISGLSIGSGTLNICSSTGQTNCSSLYVTVSYNAYPTYTPYPTPYPTPTPTSSPISFSQSSVSLTSGQSTQVSIYGLTPYSYSGTNYYLAYNSNSNAITTSISGSTLYINAVNNYGNSNNVVVVCATSSNCAALPVNVNVATTNTGNWTYCASENGWCGVPDTRQVRYGANGLYVYRWVSGGITCSNANFGDPIFGVAKQCSYAY